MVSGGDPQGSSSEPTTATWCSIYPTVVGFFFFFRFCWRTYFYPRQTYEYWKKLSQPIMCLKLPWRHFTGESPGWILSYGTAGGTGANGQVRSHRSFCTAPSALCFSNIFSLATKKNTLALLPWIWNDNLGFCLLVSDVLFIVCRASHCLEVLKDLHNLDCRVFLCGSLMLSECLACHCTLCREKFHTWTFHVAIMRLDYRHVSKH